jgi:signal transduction histidine kinase
MVFENSNKSYYKYRIILTFSVVTALVVIVLSQISYSFIKKLYLTQISENLQKNVRLVNAQIDSTQLDLVKFGIITKSTNNYFHKFFNKRELKNFFSEIFIFDKNLKIIIHSNKFDLIGKVEPRLYLNQKEIIDLKENKIFTSLPFKGNDGNWYLWGFKRLSENYWLAVKDNANNFNSLESLSNLFWYFGICGILISILIGIFIAKSLTSPISKLVNFSEEIGKGNLNVEIPKNVNGELEVLSNAMNLMKENIKDNNKEKEKILAQIAHEIRNPLGGIELLTNLINESDDENKKNEYTHRILGEIGGLKELITSYLNYSKPAPAFSEKIKLTELISETLDVFKKEFEELNISVDVKVENEEMVFDKSQLRNILLNLISNSIESIKKNGQILIKTFLENGKDFISISDNGIGIENKNMNKIFEPFFTTKSNGTGLGLATCKKYCEENDAQISVKSLKQGISFIISKNKL